MQKKKPIQQLAKLGTSEKSPQPRMTAVCCVDLPATWLCRMDPDMIHLITLSVPHSIQLRMTGILMNWKGYGRKWSWPSIRYCPCSYQDGIKNTLQPFSGTWFERYLFSTQNISVNHSTLVNCCNFKIRTFHSDPTVTVSKTRQVVVWVSAGHSKPAVSLGPTGGRAVPRTTKATNLRERATCCTIRNARVLAD
jgi:hypothetical protein